MRDNTITLEGNLVRDVEMLYANNGNGYTRNAVAVDKRKRNGDDWVTETSFFDFSILDEKMAENFCESLTKGDRVVLTGALQSRTVENDEGEKRTFIGIVVENIGPSLRWATTTVVRNPKNEGEKTAKPAAGDDFFDN